MERLTELLSQIEPSDKEWEEKGWERLRSQIRPRGSLGHLETVGARLAGITRTLAPDLGRKIIFTMAGDHGVAAEGVSAYPQEVTAQMVYSFPHHPGQCPGSPDGPGGCLCHDCRQRGGG